MLKTVHKSGHLLKNGKMRACGSADFRTGSGENYGLKIKVRVCLVLGV